MSKQFPCPLCEGAGYKLERLAGVSLRNPTMGELRRTKGRVRITVKLNCTLCGNTGRTLAEIVMHYHYETLRRNPLGTA